MVGSYDDKSESILEFGKKFKERWGDDINLFSVNGYEAGQILIAALEMSGIKNTKESLQDDRAKLREAYDFVRPMIKCQLTASAVTRSRSTTSTTHRRPA